MVAVRPSRIHGYGLFAIAPIREGELIGEVEGIPAIEDGPYVLWIDEDTGVFVTNDMRWINHDKQANAAYFDDLTVVALRDIAVGEEITHDYGWDEDPEELPQPEMAIGESSEPDALVLA